MKLAERTFNRKDYQITSRFGYRAPIKTSAGVTSSFHSGVDYGTHGQKWEQYALEDGTCYAAGTLSDGCKFCKIRYPRINLDLEYFHLDKVNVVAGQKVTHNTCIGTTGMSGKATGVHLHLGVSYIGKTQRFDAESVNYTPPTSAPATTTSKPKSLMKGDKYTLNKVPIYTSSTAVKASGTKSGVVYLYDGVVTKGRTRVTISRDYCGLRPIGKYVTGWVDVAALK